MRVFVIVNTQENQFRFTFMQKEHGLLHDRAQKKSYAVVRDARPTNWRGRFARAYFVQETSAQTVDIEGQQHAVHGGTVELKEPLNMIARIRMPGQRGEDGQVRETHLTAEAIYDRTLSAQVRRLGNRRFQWFHAVAFASVGALVALLAVAVIIGFSSHPASAPATNGPVIVTPGTTMGAPQSGPAPTPSIVVQPGTAPSSVPGG